VVNTLALLQPHRTEYRVSIFGSARTRPGTVPYEQVKELARKLASQGCAIVTGGGPGLMQAANEGERLGDTDGKRRTIGVRVELPFEQGANPFVEQAYLHGTFFSRLHHFVRLSNAFVVVDGGIGTTLEALMVWQLLQVRHIRDVPLVLVGPMWRGFIVWAKEYMLSADPPLANPSDLDIPVCVDTAAEAVAVIEAHAKTWVPAPPAR
jgi:uncharacterized protein (TIGR00730 family)